MDTTHLELFAMDPHTLRWVGVDLTVPMDWYSRCITGLRLTPMSTKAIDAVSVLYQSFGLMPAGTGLASRSGMATMEYRGQSWSNSRSWSRRPPASFSESRRLIRARIGP